MVILLTPGTVTPLHNTVVILLTPGTVTPLHNTVVIVLTPGTVTPLYYTVVILLTPGTHVIFNDGPNLEAVCCQPAQNLDVMITNLQIHRNIYWLYTLNITTTNLQIHQVILVIELRCYNHYISTNTERYC